MTQQLQKTQSAPQYHEQHIHHTAPNITINTTYNYSHQQHYTSTAQSTPQLYGRHAVLPLELHMHHHHHPCSNSSTQATQTSPPPQLHEKRNNSSHYIYSLVEAAREGRAGVSCNIFFFSVNIFFCSFNYF